MMCTRLVCYLLLSFCCKNLKCQMKNEHVNTCGSEPLYLLLRVLVALLVNQQSTNRSIV